MFSRWGEERVRRRCSEKTKEAAVKGDKGRRRLWKKTNERNEGIAIEANKSVFDAHVPEAHIHTHAGCPHEWLPIQLGLAKGANCSVCGDHKIRCTRLFRCDVCEQYCCIPCHSEAAAFRKGEAPRVRRGRRQGQKGQKGALIVGDLTNPNVVPMGKGMVVSSGTSVTAGHHLEA